jgi:Transglycosylase SLT domain
VLLTGSGGSMSVGDLQGRVAAPDSPAQVGDWVAAEVSSARGQAIGADGDSPPTAEPPPDTELITPIAPAGERDVHLAPTGMSNGIPVSVLAAYRHAATVLGQSMPGCHLPMTLLAAIGKVESGHASGGRVDDRGTTLRAILGPVLNGGPGMAAIRDTDGGRYDGNTVWDRAVGPMQFIPSTWQRWATDGNNDGVADPHNVYDASMASGRYLCTDHRDLATANGLDAAIFSYNHSMSYVRLVLAWMNAYANGTAAIPDGTGPTGGSGSNASGGGGSNDGAQAAPAPPEPAVPAQPGPDEPDVGDPGDPGDPNQPPSGGPPTTTPPSTPAPAPGSPATPPDGPAPAPAEPDLLAPVVCTVQDVLGVGTGLIGRLIGLPPSSPIPECTPPPGIEADGSSSESSDQGQTLAVTADRSQRRWGWRTARADRQPAG